MRSRNLVLLLAGVTVALVTLFVSWRFGVVFFLLPLFFVWSWGGGGEHDSGEGTRVERSSGRAEGGGEGQSGRGGDAAEREGDDGPGAERPGRRPPTGPGLDGEGI